MPKKVIVWDFDGPINSTHKNKNAEIDCSTINLKDKDPAREVIIQPLSFLTLTLKLLEKNNVMSVLGSQRITYKDDGSAVLKQDMFNSLDHAFGSEREYLKKDEANEIGEDIAPSTTDKSKVQFLDKYFERYKNETLGKSDIILVDDNATEYKKSTEDAGYSFIHAPRRGETLLEDQAYLFEVLLAVATPEKILADMDEMIAAKKHDHKELKKFESSFLDFIISKNVSQVDVATVPSIYSWQKKLFPKAITAVNQINKSYLAENEKRIVCRNVTRLALIPNSTRARKTVESNISFLKSHECPKTKCLIGALQMFAGAAVMVAGVSLGLAATSTIIGAPSFIAVGAGALLGSSLFAKGACTLKEGFEDGLKGGFFTKSAHTKTLSTFFKNSSNIDTCDSISDANITTEHQAMTFYLRHIGNTVTNIELNTNASDLTGNPNTCNEVASTVTVAKSTSNDLKSGHKVNTGNPEDLEYQDSSGEPLIKVTLP